MTRTVPNVAMQVPGNTISSALWNSGPKAMCDFYTGVPMFRGRQGTSVGTGNGLWVAMPINTVDVDTDSGHTTNSTRYTCQVAGLYYAQGSVAWAGAGGQSRIDCAIAHNGAVFLGSRQALIKQAADLSALSAVAFVQMAVGDYVEVWGKQTTGGTLSTFIGSDLCPCLNVFWFHS